MRDDGPRLTDEDLRRLARLGGGVEQIAEAAGIDAVQVCRRLTPADERDRTARPDQVLVPAASSPA